MIKMPKTLAEVESLPHKRRLDLTTYPLSRLAAATKTFKDICGSEVSPDVRALEFYGCNQIYSKLRQQFTPNEVLPEWASKLAGDYRFVLVDQAERLMHYMLCIIVREARHLPGNKLDALLPKLEQLTGQDMKGFMTSIISMDELGAVNHLLNHPVATGAGQFVRAIEWVFDHGWVGKTAYGGKSWGNIARCLADCLTGKTSMEMMVDTAYTLAHNGGPMFNKGMMYSHHSGDFVTLLDVQAGGQVVELLHTNSDYKFVPSISGMFQVVEHAYAHMPDQFGQYVDWQAVMAADIKGEHKYMNLLKKVQAKHPQVQTFRGQPAKQSGVFQITVGEEVPVFERIAT